MWKKTLGYGLLAVVVIAGGGFAYLYFRKPATAPASGIKVALTPERIARGKFLFTTLCDCDGCHSERDYTRFGAPVVPSGRGRGQVMPLKGLPGTLVAPNITPDRQTGIGNWTDGEKIRAIREGVDRDGNTLFPMMPYPSYRYMSDEDVQALVAYLDTLAPVRNPLPKTKIDFPVSMLIKGVPQPAGSVAPPDQTNQMVYGEYLATMAGCEECHTPMVRGQADSSMRFAGGRVFETPFGTVVSANITPDPETGIGQWDWTRFLQRFRFYRAYVENGPPKIGPDRFTLMPWLGLSQLPEGDLQAIFTYIKSRQPIAHKVETHPKSF